MRSQLHLIALKVFGALPKPVQNRCVRILAPTFTVGTAVILLDGNGNVLLVEQPYTDGWALPGGLVSGKEEPAQTASRELAEELGLDVDFSGRHPIAVRTPWRRHFNFLFSATIGTIDPADMLGHTPEISQVGWFPLTNLPELAEFTDSFLEAVGALPPSD